MKDLAVLMRVESIVRFSYLSFFSENGEYWDLGFRVEGYQLYLRITLDNEIVWRSTFFFTFGMGHETVTWIAKSGNSGLFSIF